ncbi:MAG: NAD(P)H-dependent glycerol-3-phosphate dehydrogenase [Acidimicrobiaceae bacterium]|nr:NAD(P)H-dependent glycerol-3-phosphate dehydrogenase [Acidimicrobiaceae bacterium]
MEMQVAVLGAGSWGTTVAHLSAHNVATTLYSRRDDVARAVNARHENPRYLPGYRLHESLRASSDLASVVSAADVLVMGVPSAGFRDTLRELRPSLRPWVPVVSLAKGLELSTRLRMTQVAEDELPGHPVGVLTGPNLAKEILAGDPAAAVVAFDDETISQRLQEVFSTDLFRVYINTDVLGCEIAGALKNVFALAAGMADGLGAGDNTRAAVITRGLAELTRLGVAMGGEPATFAGLAGMGDLLATCMSPQSRNRYVGEQLGRGRSLDEINAEMDQVAEGVKSVRIVVELAAEHDVYMPISQEVYSCVQGLRGVEDAYRDLIARVVTHE